MTATVKNIAITNNTSACTKKTKYLYYSINNIIEQLLFTL